MDVAVQWSVDKLKAALGTIERGVREQRDEISRNNGRLVALEQRAKSIPDPARRAAALASIKDLVRRQEKIVAAWRTFSQRGAELAARARAFLGGGQALGEIGAVFIPPALAALAAVGLAGYLWIREANKVQAKHASNQEQLVAALTAGKITPEELIKVSAQFDAEARAAEPKGDPLGLTQLVEALVPLALIAAAIILLPPLLEGRRRLVGARS